MMENQDKKIEAMDALEFLRGHPALAIDIYGDSMFDGFWFMMAKCCKRGQSDYAGFTGVTIYSDDTHIEKYKDRFIDEHGSDWDKEVFNSIEISYEEYYGEPWVFDHVEYWYETTFFVFEGNPYSNHDYMDRKYWSGHVGPQGGENTWEDMIIDCAKEVKKAFGDFNLHESFLTEAERVNNQRVRVFNMEQGEKKTQYSLVRNPEFVWVHNGLCNLRWAEWFIKTDYAKKNWDCSIPCWKQFIEKIDIMEPEERKEILAKEEYTVEDTSS